MPVASVTNMRWCGLTMKMARVTDNPENVRSVASMTNMRCDLIVGELYDKYKYKYKYCDKYEVVWFDCGMRKRGVRRQKLQSFDSRRHFVAPPTSRWAYIFSPKDISGEKRRRRDAQRVGGVRRGGQGLCRRSFTRWGFKLAKIVQGSSSKSAKTEKESKQFIVKYSQFSFHSESCESEMWNVLR